MKFRHIITVSLFLALVFTCQMAFAAPICTIGSRGEDVEFVQNQLYVLGYLQQEPGEPYQYDDTTANAIRRFQYASQLPVTGVVDETTYTMIGLSTAATYDDYLDAIYIPGGSAPEVVELNKRLKALGYMRGEPGKIFDQQTTDAIMAFQEANHLPVNGIPNKETRDVLFSDDAISYRDFSNASHLSSMKKGDTGEEVSYVQEQLNDLGYYTSTVNGRFDDNTVAAVKLFQEANSLTINGIANETTRMLLNSGTAISFDEYKTVLAYKELRQGAKGLSVQILQERLSELGYYSGAINAKYNATVKKSVSNFQVANGLSANGIANIATRNIMNSEAALDRFTALGYMIGDKGEVVLSITESLHQLGYLKKALDVYNNTVAAAVKRFQKANGLKVTGIADSKTMELLLQADAETYLEGDTNSRNPTIEAVIKVGKSQLGKPYTSPCNPPANFDCSGFVRYCMKNGAGIKLVGEVEAQGNYCKKHYTVINNMANLKRGDLIYFDTQANKPIGHAAIYLGIIDDKPSFIHASSSKGCVVITPFNEWYKDRFLFGARWAK